MQGFVIKALLKREMLTRFGKYKLGFLWMLVDPLVSVIVLGLLLGPILGRSSGPIPYAFFLLCGFMLLKTLTDTMNVAMGAITANQGLLVFRQVQPIDPFLSRFIFILLTRLLSFVLFCLIGSWLGIDLSIQSIWSVLGGLLIVWMIGCGLGLTFGVICIKFKELEKIHQYVQRPLIFISCVLYSINTIPAEYQHIMLLNPLAHCIEVVRQGLFPDYVPVGVNLFYPFLCALVCMTFGMMTYRNNRHFLTER